MTLIAAPVIQPFSSAMITAFQTMMTLTAFQSQVKDATPYGKFALGKEMKISVPGKIGMLLIYCPALIYLASAEVIPKMDSISFDKLPERNVIVSVFLLIHFAKRVLETLFLHKYSGQSDGIVTTFIGLYYAFVSWQVVAFNRVAVDSSMLSNNLLYIGAATFLIGELGNLYHHYLLAQLRKGSSTTGAKKYFSPKGGLFTYVAAPHYLFELIAWLGIAIVAQHSNALIVFLSMVSYLSGRAKVTNEWNMKNIDDYEPRKNILPGIF